MPALHLQTNIPVTGTIKYVNRCPSHKQTNGVPWDDQIGLNGDWNVGQGQFYLPLAVEGELKRAGIISGEYNDKTYKMLMRSPKVSLVRKEDGRKQIHLIQVLDGSPQQASANGTGSYQSSRPSTQPAGAYKQTFATLCRGMGNAVGAAVKIAKEYALNEGVAALANTLFIQAIKEGLLQNPPPPITQAQLDLIGSLCAQLNHDDPWLNQVLSEKYKVQSVHQLTEAAAGTLIKELQADLSKQEADRVAAAQQPTPGFFEKPETEDIPF